MAVGGVLDFAHTRTHCAGKRVRVCESMHERTWATVQQHAHAQRCSVGEGTSGHTCDADSQAQVIGRGCRSQLPVQQEEGLGKQGELAGEVGGGVRWRHPQVQARLVRLPRHPLGKGIQSEGSGARRDLF